MLSLTLPVRLSAVNFSGKGKTLWAGECKRLCGGRIATLTRGGSAVKTEATTEGWTIGRTS